MNIQILFLFLVGLVSSSTATKCACNSRRLNPVCGEPESGSGVLIEFKNVCALRLYNCNNKGSKYFLKFYGFCSDSSEYYSSSPPSGAIAMMEDSYSSGSLDARKANRASHSATSTTVTSTSTNSVKSNQSVRSTLSSSSSQATETATTASTNIPSLQTPNPLPSISTSSPAPAAQQSSLYATSTVPISSSGSSNGYSYSD